MNMNSVGFKPDEKAQQDKVSQTLCLQMPFFTMLLLWCLWEGEFYQKGQTLGPARVGRHDKVWACNVLYQTWQPLWPSGQTSGFFPHPALLYRTNTSLHYSHHLNLTGETISTQPHSSWWCVCVLYNWCVMLKWDQAQVSQRGNCFTTWIRASVEWGSRGKLDLWGSHSVSSTSFVSCQTNVSPHQHKVFALSILYRGCIVHLNLV